MRCLLKYRAIGLNVRKFSGRDSNIHPDCTPERREAGKTPRFSPCAFPTRLRQVCHGEPSDYRGTDQTLHEADEPLLVHGVLIDHKMDIALTADRRDHIDSLPLRLYWQYGRPALGRKAALYYLAVAYPCLIRPIDDGIFCFRTPCNSRILLLFPPSDAIRILFPRALRRSLAAHALALHVVRQRPFVDGFVELFLDVLPRSP